MKAKVWIETEAEVDVSVSDMIAALHDLPEPEKLGLALNGLSACLSYLKKLPDDLVARMNDAQRDIITSVLAEQLARYGMPKPADGTDSGCICRGNWRDIVSKTEQFIGRQYRDRQGNVRTFFGVVHAEDDFYYGMYGSEKLDLLSCVGSIESHGYEFIREA